MTCWRRQRDWNEAGVWQRLHEASPAELNAAGALDFSKAVVDGSHIAALKGGATVAPANRSSLAALGPLLTHPCYAVRGRDDVSATRFGERR
jgi:hypothetical protein